ncbi:MAG: hypothetical protein AB8G17_16980 [Gammaproteobacteria bacterium]
MGSEPPGQGAPNLLHRLAAAGGVLLGLFFVAGALGHVAAAWPAVDSSATPPGTRHFAILLPGLILLSTGLLNILLCKSLWSGTAWALQLALVINVIAAAYLAHLLSKGMPGHPIGIFVALVSSHVILLGAIRLGLVWPASGR